MDDLRDLPDDGSRYEVIDGELQVTPAPTWVHQRAILRLYALLSPHVDRERLGDVIVAPADVVFSPKRGVQPDLFVAPLVAGKRPGSFREAGRLLLAVEVLSPSTARWDRVQKRKVYREEHVPEYWVVDLEKRGFERSRDTGDGVEVVPDQLVWSPEGSTEPLVIDIERYFSDVLDA